MEIEIYELLMLDAQTARAARQLWIQEFDPSKSSQRVGKLEQIHIWQHYIYCYRCIYVCSYHSISHVFPMFALMCSLQVIFQWSLDEPWIRAGEGCPRSQAGLPAPACRHLGKLQAARFRHLAVASPGSEIGHFLCQLCG